MERLIARGLVVFLIFVAAPSFSQSLIAEEAMGDLSPEIEAELSAIRALPLVMNAQVVMIDPSVLANPEVILSLAAIDGPVLSMSADPETALMAGIRLENGESFGWSGDMIDPTTPEMDNSVTSIIEVDSNRQVYGSIIGQDASYEIRPIGSESHVLIEYRMDQFPPEHPSEPPISPDQNFEDGSLSPDIPDVLPSISVLVAFTPSVAQLYANPEVQARVIVASANAVYERSRIPTRLELVGFTIVDYAEGSTMHDDLKALRLKSDNLMDSVHGLRNEVKADLVHLIVSREDFCGLAYVNPDQDWAFGVTTIQCAVPNLSFAHEVGHNFGACHDPANAGSCTPYTPDGFGFQHPDGLYRDVMAYNCPDKCPRRPVLSHPTEYGVLGENDVRRLTLLRTSIIAGFR